MLPIVSVPGGRGEDEGRDCELFVYNKDSLMTNVALGTFYVIAPVLVIVGMGYLAGKLGWIKDVAVDSLTKIVFYVGLPALLIDEISRADLSTFIRMKGPLVVVVVAVIMGILGYVTALLFKVSADKRGVWAQASFRANMGFVGLPVVMNALGETGIHYCSLVLAVGVPTFNILSVIVLFLPQRGEGGKIPLAKMVGGVLRNPLVIACVIGFLFSFVRPDKLKILDVSLFHLKHLPLPLALLAIGAKLDVRRS
ncbi:MAG: AEC family transporter, partial [Spirochaetota bacterium]|nr:AEC family transporter [Spirochaetota bacterium]